MFCFTYRKHLREYVGHFFRNPICRLCGAGAWPPGVRGSVAASARHVCLVAVVVRVPVVSMVKFHRRTFRYESCVAVSRDSCHVHGFENGGREHVENPDSHLTQPIAISLEKRYMPVRQTLRFVHISTFACKISRPEIEKCKLCIGRTGTKCLPGSNLQGFHIRPTARCNIRAGTFVVN